jgi:hypothetical protein
MRRWSRLAVVLALLLVSCAGRLVRQTVFEDQGTEVILRSRVKGGEPVERGFDHPMSISTVRLAHILSRLEIRTEAKDGSQRSPAIPLESLYLVADGVAKALAVAGPHQEVVVLSVRKDKHFVLFDRKHLTSFVTYRKDDLLYVHLVRSEWEVEPRREDRLPEPDVGEHVMKFRVLPSKAMTLVDSQSVVVDWRDPVFKRPTRTRLTPGGKVVRREILLESEEPEAVDPTPVPLPDGLSPAALRALADLEELRRQGTISEAQYNARRLEILRSGQN